MADLFRPVGTVTAFKDIGIPPSTRPHGISRQSFLVYPLDLHMRITVAFLDFVTFGPLILRMRLGIKFLFVRLRFRYPFFSPAPHDINLGNRFKVRRQLRPGGLSPQTDGMPVIPKTAIRNASDCHFRHVCLQPKFSQIRQSAYFPAISDKAVPTLTQCRDGQTIHRYGKPACPG